MEENTVFKNRGSLFVSLQSGKGLFILDIFQGMVNVMEKGRGNKKTSFCEKMPGPLIGHRAAHGGLRIRAITIQPHPANTGYQTDYWIPNKPMTAKADIPRHVPPTRRGVFAIFRFLAFLFLFALIACQSYPRFTVETLPRYESLFQRTSGWTGGDGAYSAALGNDRFLWLFGDSLIGEVKD